MYVYVSTVEHCFCDFFHIFVPIRKNIDGWFNFFLFNFSSNSKLKHFLNEHKSCKQTNKIYCDVNGKYFK